jgi:hypothetical protein
MRLPLYSQVFSLSLLILQQSAIAAWLEREILLLNRLKRKLESRGLIRPLTKEETAFLDVLDEDDVSPMRGGHEEWLMDVVMTVNSVRECKRPYRTLARMAEGL